jgi:acyl-CoA dehydrogenase
MTERSHLAWPFFDDTHRAFHAEVHAWCERELPAIRALPDVDARCRALVAAMGRGGLLARAFPAHPTPRVDVRAACIAREALAQEWGLADFAFAIQGLGAGPIALFGSPALRASHAARAAAGEAIPAFAISEAAAGSDLGAVATTARRDGSHYVVDGEKMWISNAGLADFYVVFARTGEGSGGKGLSAFVVDADTAGLTTTRIEIISPHPLGRVRLEACRVPASRMVGEPGRGMAVALGTLDVFRATVGAAALGFARRALAEALSHATGHRAFGSALAELQLIQEKLAVMATTIDSSALLVYRAAWTRDECDGRVTREAAMAKYAATEGAQQVIDDAVQILGARGVVAGSILEELYREIRPLRIYEGTSEIQKLVIARTLLEGVES